MSRSSPRSILTEIYEVVRWEPGRRDPPWGVPVGDRGVGEGN